MQVVNIDIQTLFSDRTVLSITYKDTIWNDAGFREDRFCSKSLTIDAGLNVITYHDPTGNVSASLDTVHLKKLLQEFKDGLQGVQGQA
jgi:hypothetical protein